MDKLFLSILNMSLTGAFVIAAICFARLPLKKAPKIISYCLWAVAGFRLVFPFSIESVFSLVPFKAQTIPPNIAMQPIPRIDSGIPAVNNAISSFLPAATPAASVNPLQIWITVGAWVWLIGVAAVLIYGVASFVILKRNMNEATHLETNIFEAENIKSPFVLGVFNPKIYLPIGLSEQEKSYIILHEQTHIRRCDHFVKFAAYFVLCLHWFNPLAWAAFLLMGVDMEMSCDESVLKGMGSETKKDYSLSLLSLATERRIIGGSPLAFGEGGIKERIKNILKFKKTSRVILVAAVILAVVLSAGFAVNRTQHNEAISAEEGIIRDVYSMEDTYLPIHMKPFSVVTYDEYAVPAIIEGGKLTVDDLFDHEARDFIAEYPYSTEEDMLVVPYIKVEYERHGFIQNIYYLNPDYPGETRLDPTNWWPGVISSSQNDVFLYTAGLIHDGSIQTIELEAVDEWRYSLRVMNKDGKTLWETEAGLPHAGWNTILLSRVNGQDYLMQYNPVMYQGVCSYSFRVFSLSRDGKEILFDQDEVEFSINPPGAIEYFRADDIEPVKSFYNHLNQYLSVSELLLNTDDNVLNYIPERQRSRVYGTQDDPISGLRGYFYGHADWSIDDQIEAFVTDRDRSEP